MNVERGKCAVKGGDGKWGEWRWGEWKGEGRGELEMGRGEAVSYTHLTLPTKVNV